MEILKLKMFDVVCEAITIEEFERWLYIETAVLDVASSNKFVFDVLTINYKEKAALETLMKVALNRFSAEETLLLNIMSHCQKIISIKDKNLVFREVISLKANFDFDNHYDLLWQFYILKERIDLIDLGYFREGNVIQIIKQLAQTIISKYEDYFSLEDKLKLLNYKEEEHLSTW